MISIGQIDKVLQHSGSVFDQRGDRVGEVAQVFVGDESGRPEWVTVKTGLFGRSETFVPLREASMDGNDIRVPIEKNQIKDAPRTDGASGHVDPTQEAELYRHYGLEPAGEADETRDDPAGGTDGPDGGGRHVQRDDADRHIPSADGVRLRKYTVTEHVTMSVPVEREHVEVVHDDDDDAQAAGREDPYNSESHGRHPEQG
ncbi:PRC-barrel domain-containing protein [Arthrobacter castelli]|uniref:PRC-barrel domain-containing protein n=1 Tax=Arthrobacter castelli TaxID=271431 RepID=UPI00041C4DC6|nr:PRC-barrel domain-containing protein [Arthrobacter castelli]